MGRVWAAVDVNHLWVSVNAEFGRGNRVDFGKIKQTLEQRAGDPLSPNAYLTSNAFQRNDKFIRVLHHLGYFPRKIINVAVPKYAGSTIAVQIAVDAMLNMDTFDTFVLVSGDGYLLPLVKCLKDQGKRVEVYAFREATAGELLTSADHVVLMDKNFLYESTDPR